MYRLLRKTFYMVTAAALVVGFLCIVLHDTNVLLVSPFRETVRTAATKNISQKRSSSTPKPPAIATSLVKPEDPPTSCKCKLRSLSHSQIYTMTFELKMPGFNLSTREVLERQHPNFPFSLLDSILHGKRCHLMPSPHRVQWQNTYWQEVRLPGDVTFRLFSAFLDNRPHTRLRPCIRIVMLTFSEDPPKPWCYIWFNATGPPTISRITRLEYVDWQQRDETRQMTFLMSCRIPPSESHLTPKAVSIVSKPCQQPTNLLQVVGAMERNTTTAYIDGKPPQGKSSTPRWAAAVCGPALYYYLDDFSIRLVEWLEILRAQGFSQVFLLETDVHPNIQKVLRYYEAEGFVGVTKFSYPYPYMDEPSLRRLWRLNESRKMWAMENVYFTECLLRHMHQYRFIAHFDPDEIPMMANHSSFPEFLNERFRRHNTGPRPAAYMLRWYFHYDDLPTNNSLPEYVWALRHTWRSRTPASLSTGSLKSVFDMDITTGVYSHQILVCGSGGCPGRKVHIPVKLAYLGHYKKKCERGCFAPGRTQEDPSLLKYKDQVLPAVTKVLTTLKLI